MVATLAVLGTMYIWRLLTETTRKKNTKKLNINGSDLRKELTRNIQAYISRTLMGFYTGCHEIMYYTIYSSCIGNAYVVGTFVF